MPCPDGCLDCVAVNHVARSGCVIRNDIYISSPTKQVKCCHGEWEEDCNPECIFQALPLTRWITKSYQPFLYLYKRVWLISWGLCGVTNVKGPAPSRGSIKAIIQIVCACVSPSTLWVTQGQWLCIISIPPHILNNTQNTALNTCKTKLNQLCLFISGVQLGSSLQLWHPVFLWKLIMWLCWYQPLLHKKVKFTVLLSLLWCFKYIVFELHVNRVGPDMVPHSSLDWMIQTEFFHTQEI